MHKIIAQQIREKGRNVEEGSLQLKHVSQNARARACHCPLNARWLVHSLILSSQPNFGQIAKSGPKCRCSWFRLKAPEICNAWFEANRAGYIINRQSQ